MAKIITEEDILNATTYIPLEQKGYLAREYAKDCVVAVEMKIKNGEQIEVLPPRYQENPKIKSLYGLMMLLDKYLHLIDYHGEEEIAFTSKDFDEWGEASLFNQLDRMKSSKNQEVRNKIYDLLDDYREWYRMLGTEIASNIAYKNDILARFVQYFSVIDLSDALKESLLGLADTLKEIKEYQEKPKEWADEKPNLHPID